MTRRIRPTRRPGTSTSRHPAPRTARVAARTRRPGTAEAPLRALGAALLVGIGAALAFDGARAQDAERIEVAMHYSQDQAAPLLECFERYGAENGVEVAYTQVSYGDYLQTVLTSRLGGLAPDVYHLYSIWGAQLADNGVLADVPDDVRDFVEERYAAATVDAVTIDGALRGVPTEVAVYLLGSNMDLLREAGYEEPPTTFDELLEIAEAVTTRDAQGKIETAGFAFADSSSGAGLVHPFYTALYSAGVTPYADDFSSTNLASDESVAALERFRALVESGATDRSVDGYDFPAGGIAMMIMPNWIEADVRAGFGDATDETVRTSPVPFGDDWRTLQYAFFFGVDSASDKQDESWALIRWLNASDSAAEAGGPSCMATMLDGLGALTANAEDLDALEEPDAFTRPYVEALADDRAITQPNVMQAAEIERLMAQAIDEAITGDTAPAAALEDLDRTVSDILFEFY